MKHHTADVECGDGTKASVTIESSLKMAAVVIGLALTILGGLAGVFAFAYGTKGIAEAAQKDATAAIVKTDKLEQAMVSGFNRILDKMADTDNKNDARVDKLYDRLTKD